MSQPDEAARILVVDDEEEMVAALRDILSACGYEVDVAYDGSQAIERVRERRPDGILMDIRMPGVNGVDAFREIKRLSPESFVIFMTAYATSALVETARHEGAIEVLPKPLDFERLLRMIGEAVADTPVLLVDDDAELCAALADCLETQGFTVRAAGNVEEAIRSYEKEPRRVVILDMKLDDQLGLDAFVVIKELNPRAIVILMTGFHELRGEVEKGLEMSAYACLWKPFEIDDLVRTIRDAVAQRRLPRGGGT